MSRIGRRAAGGSTTKMAADIEGREEKTGTKEGGGEGVGQEEERRFPCVRREVL